jgi:AcrR family transcriptional regulator
MTENATLRERRRAAIMTAARDLYAAHGVDAVRMDDVAAAAGCTRRTVYAYFPNWEDLSLAVSLDSLEERWAFQRQAVEAQPSGFGKLRAWADSYRVFTLAQPSSLRTQLYWDYHAIDRDAVGEEMRDRFDTVVGEPVAVMRAAFAQARAEGSVLPDLDADEVLGQFAYTLRAVLNRVLYPAISFADFEPDSFVRGFIRRFLRGIAADPHALDRPDPEPNR